jgi:hypothetical protein
MYSSFLLHVHKIFQIALMYTVKIVLLATLEKCNFRSIEITCLIIIGLKQLFLSLYSPLTDNLIQVLSEQK